MVNFFFLDSCKALEKEAGGEELDNVLRLVVALALEKKHEEYLQKYPPTDADRQVYYGRWVPRLATKLGLSEEMVQTLLGVVKRTRLDFDSPHVGIRGAAVFASAGHIVKSDDEKLVNISIAASPDAVTVTSLRSIKPGEALTIANPLKHTPPTFDLSKAAELFATMSAQEWISGLKSEINAQVFSKGTPVVDKASNWPDLEPLVALRSQLAETFASDPYALSLLATCLVMGGRASGAALVEAPEAEKTAQMWAAYPRSLLQKEKNFSKPWLSTFYATVTKFYKSVPQSFHGLVTREINK